MFSLMWCEHCAYKHSKKLLRRLPTEGPRVVMGPGENAGAVDVGGGLAVAFKVESHNHPSAVEPFQGAATGVGGHPARRLRRGRAADRRARLAALRRARRRSARATCSTAPSRASATTATRSACPTVGGEVYFEAAYEQNCLVNAMCLGLAERDRLIRSAGQRAGQPARAVRRARPGATGSAARRCWPRAELAETDEAKRPTRADRRPVRGEEAARVLARAARARPARLAAGPRRGGPDLVVERDGRARAGSGSTSTSARVPLREAGMEPFEIMVSESQERMLCVVEPERLDEVARRVREVGDHGDGDRRGHRHRSRCACSTAMRSSATCP